MATAVVSSEATRRRWRLPDRIANLRGKGLTAYTVLWVAALFLAILAPIRGEVEGYQQVQDQPIKRCGLVLWAQHGTTTVAAFFGQASALGTPHSGDTLVGVDGWPVGRSTIYEVGEHLPRAEGAEANLLLREPSARQHIATVRCSQSLTDGFYRSAGISLSVFVVVVLLCQALPALFLVPAAMLLFVRRRGEAIPSLLSFAFLALAACQAAGGAGLAAWHTPEIAQLGLNSIGWSALLLALATFPDGRFQPRWTRLLLLTFPLLFSGDASLLPRWFADDAASLVLTATAAAALIVRSRQVPAGAERQQLRWAFLGFGLFVAVLITLLPFYVFSYQLVSWDARWQVWRWVSVDPLLSVAFVLMPAGLMISILRYRLYDADTVIGRSAAYGVLTIGFVALFAGTEKLAEIVGERYFEHSIGIAAGAIGAAVAAACVVPLHNRVHRWAERRFQKALIRLREGLPECLVDLRDTASVTQIAETVMRRVEAGVRSTREAVLLRDGERFALAGSRRVTEPEIAQWRSGWGLSSGEHSLDCDRKDALFPLRVRLYIETGDEPETIGWLLLGPRPDGSFFGKDERDALEHVAGPIARAIHIAQLREQREGRAEERLSMLEGLVEKLSASIGSRRPARA